MSNERKPRVELTDDGELVTIPAGDYIPDENEDADEELLSEKPKRKEKPKGLPADMWRKPETVWGKVAAVLLRGGIAFCCCTYIGSLAVIAIGITTMSQAEIDATFLLINPVVSAMQTVLIVFFGALFVSGVVFWVFMGDTHAPR